MFPSVHSLSLFAIFLSPYRVVNTIVSGAGGLVFGFCYSNMKCVDSELLLKKGDVKLRAMITMKCFVSGEYMNKIGKIKKNKVE